MNEKMRDELRQSDEPLRLLYVWANENLISEDEFVGAVDDLICDCIYTSQTP